MSYLKVVAILFSAFHIQILAGILSIFDTSVPAPSPDANLTFYATMLAAVIGALISIAAIIVSVVQFSTSRKYERENQLVQQQNEDLQRRLDKASQTKQFEKELEKLHFKSSLEARRETLERERERKAGTRAAARAVMVQARTTDERSDAYRK